MTKSRNLGMRTLWFVVCLLCVVSLAWPAAAAEVSLEENQTYTTIVRISARKNSAPIGQMENGTAVTVLGTQGDFYKIDCYDMVGYVAKSQVTLADDGKYYVSCDTASSETAVFQYTDHADALALRHNLLELAIEQIGSRYVYGSARPGAFDCSGLTSYLYGNHGISLLRRASQQLQNGVIVPKEAMQVGDLVFFRRNSSVPADHVGIYAGNNQIIHAGTSTGVVYSDLDFGYFEDYFLCARRVVVSSTAPAETLSLTANSVSGRTVR